MAQRRRRRIRPGDSAAAGPAGEPPERATDPPARTALPPERATDPPARTAVPPERTAVPPARRARERPAEDRETERGLRGLVGGGASQVSVSAALRARDAARPRPDDLAAAEEDLPIVLRGWVPRDPPPAR